jgi:hypothetical protein
MTIEIQELRISFSQMLVFPEFVPKNASMAYLGQQIGFQNKFDELQSIVVARANNAAPGRSQKPVFKPGEPTVPWLKRHHFWEYYLEKPKELSSVNGNQAWRYKVPLRVAFPAKALSILPPLTHLNVEGYLYIHGVAVVIRVTIGSSESIYLPLETMVNDALLIMTKSVFNVEWADQTRSAQPITLKQLAMQTLNYLATVVLGKHDGAGMHLCEPFTLTTVIRGNGLDLDQLRTNFETKLQQVNNPLEAQIAVLEPRVHQALDGLATWNLVWQDNVAHPSKEAVLNFRGAATQPGYIIYGLRHSRVIWFPSYFMDKTKDLHLLGCYHSNLTIGSLQTNSLLEFIHFANNWFANHSSLHPLDKEVVKRAVVLLSMLYCRTDNTYRSWSLRQQIESSGLISAINHLRNILNVRGGAPIPP